MTRRLRFLLACATPLLVMAVAAVCWLEARGKPSRPATPGALLTQETYVWQRAWRAPLRQSVVDFRDACDGFVVLAAQVTWSGQHGQVVATEADFALLARQGKRVGLAVRVGLYGGPLASDDSAAALLADVCQTSLSKARAAGIKPSELQIDFDCPESKLEGYRLWLTAIRKRLDGTPLTFTALPSWLHRGEFAALAAEADGFVLQVHSLKAPKDGRDFVLCDAQAAQRWAAQAGTVGKPFRIALPTYAYVAATDEAGKLIGLSAEGPSLTWPPDAHLRTVWADPAEMAALIREFSAAPPELMTGILWYRLPSGEDRFNWSPRTLRAVMAGRSPLPALRARTVKTPGGPVEIELVNDGEADGPLPPSVSATFAGRAVAADGVNGYRTLDSETGQVHYRRGGDSLGMLPPGAALRIGWLRFDHDTDVSVSISYQASD